jgi:beta-carotene 3-hydroxylase
MIAVYVLVALITFAFMEFVAWALHKYGMHGPLWGLHEDHHHPKTRGWEKNDLFALFFALISFGSILAGTLANVPLLIAFGAGVTMYGVGYFLVHDVFFHRRVRLGYRPKGPYWQRVYNAHRHHHRESTPETGVSFGFLYAPPRYAPKE